MTMLVRTADLKLKSVTHMYIFEHNKKQIKADCFVYCFLEEYVLQTS